MAEKEFKKDVEIFHFNKETGQYKALEVNKKENEDTYFVKIAKGVKTDTSSSNENIVIALNRQELAYLKEELNRLYNK
ncbi:hypothetical protein MMKA1_p-00060 (plasmid) [Methanococcus maripaludis KA1]|uniref:Uncharacterized protein n=1 Tax=Methanococcus maripaludis KA1 TaxID=637914 RepID=A0A2Z5PEV4_METMI|nr:hypothetical protein [Methanococcus maripaludis]BAP62079.1 hypothetical protein MMKA1_p-00060 [Methanococcus maripaludis KA1]